MFPIADSCIFKNGKIAICFAQSGNKMTISENIYKELKLTADGAEISGYSYEQKENALFLSSPAFKHAAEITVAYAQSACPSACLKNRRGIPILPFSFAVQTGY